MCIRVALLGGTGDIGEGSALRRAYRTDHEVVIGLRDPDETRAKVDEYGTELSSRGCDVEVNGFTNEMAADRTSMAVLAMPPYHVSGTVEAVSDSSSEGDMFVTPTTSMKRDNDDFHYHPPRAGSMTALVADAAPDDVPVVDTSHDLAAGRLADLDTDLGVDTLLVADDKDAKETVRLLTEGVDGLRVLDSGNLADASEIEGITPLLINVAWNDDGLHGLSVRFK